MRQVKETKGFSRFLAFVFLANVLFFSQIFISQVGFAGETKKLNVVVTTSMIADAVRQVGGERVNVKALMGPGVDPHAYRQTRTDIVKLTRADLIFWHGLYLEAQMEEFFQKLAKRKKVVALGDLLPKASLLGHDDYKGRYDPHIWMNPKLWSKLVVFVHDKLIEVDPNGKALFEKNLQAHMADISKLSDYSKNTLGTVPQNQRVLVTAHDAFNYFGTTYGFDVVGIQGISTESEAGLKRIEQLVDLLVKKKISAVFVESSVADRNVKALIEGAAAKGHKVIVGGELFSDAMGQNGSYEGTYIGMIDHNVTVITRALGGEAPQGGLQGRLGASH